MITQNSYLRPHGIHTYNTCRAAGVCAATCYAHTHRDTSRTTDHR